MENNVNKRVSAHPVIYVFLIFPIICKVPSQCDNPFFCLDEFKGSADFETNVSVSPYSWYHVCLGLDTVSGLLRIVMNGHMIQNEEKEFFRGTDSIRPKSLAGKLGGKIESYQSLGTECCAILHLIPTNQFSTFKLNELCFSFQNIHNWFLVHE